MRREAPDFIRKGACMGVQSSFSDQEINPKFRNFNPLEVSG